MDHERLKHLAGIKLTENLGRDEDELLIALLRDINTLSNNVESGEVERTLKGLYNKYKDERDRKYIKW